jgi:hypothetical protein
LILAAEFRICEKGNYSFDLPNNFTRTCKKGKENFECRGGDQVFPLLGYWRQAKNDTIAINCLIEKAWIGGDKVNMTLNEIEHGACAEGHHGNLCNDCLLGYGKYKAKSLCKK